VAFSLLQSGKQQESVPVYYPSPNVSRPASQLTEEEQVKIASKKGKKAH